MQLIRDKHNRGRTSNGWLDSFHTFSFGGFRDPGRMGHRALRVINEDHVIPGAGFGEHRHTDMDILTLVMSGKLSHKDSTGASGVLAPGEIQHMFAGNGVTHSEMNASTEEAVHFLQIWIVPDESGVPYYEQQALPLNASREAFIVIASPNPSDESVRLHSDTYVFYASPSADKKVSHEFDSGRSGYLHVVSGIIDVLGERLAAGDGLQFADVNLCEITADTSAEILLFDLA